MKLYKNTFIISIIVFLVCIILSFIFGLTYIAKFKLIQMITDYFIGTACSAIVVIITTFLQFKYEQRKVLSSILTDINFFFFHYLLFIIYLVPNENFSDKRWEHYFDETYNEAGKITSELANLEWLSKKMTRTTSTLQKTIFNVLIDMAPFYAEKKKDNILSIINSPWLKDIKDNAMLLINSDDYTLKEIIRNYEKLQCEIETIDIPYVNKNSFFSE